MGDTFVTILFTDFVGSTALLSRRGDDAASEWRREQLATIRAAIAPEGGREIKSTGDGLMVAFTSAVAAVRCAVAMQRANEPGEGPRLRAGLDAGEPVADGDDLYGTPVIVASRLCVAAGPGEILVSDVVRQVAGSRVDVPFFPRGSMRLRGLDTPVAFAEVGWREDPVAGEPEPDARARPITVVIADDQKLLRTGFRVILEAESDMTVVGEAADGHSAVDVVLRRRPDVVLMDIRMPEMTGLQAAERILSEPGLDTAVLVLTTFDLNEYVYEALRIGASGFLLKDGPADRLIDAVRVVAAGEALLAPSVTRRLIGSFASAARPAVEGVPDQLSELTSRELEVLRLIAQGLSNSEIAAALVLGENTIKTHVARILSKLGLRDRVQAVVLAYETGLVAADHPSG